METSAEALPSWPSTDRARLYNGELAALLARHPRRLSGLGCVDPWAGEVAARELERMVTALGFAGALVNPADGRRYLDDSACAPLLAAAERLRRPLRAAHARSARRRALQRLRDVADHGATDPDRRLRGTAHLLPPATPEPERSPLLIDSSERRCVVCGRPRGPRKREAYSDACRAALEL